MIRYRGKGLPHEVFTKDFRDSQDLRSEVGIGHVRYATKGEDNPDNAPPVRVMSVDAVKKICGKKCYGCVEGSYPYKFKGMDKTPFKFEPV